MSKPALIFLALAAAVLIGLFLWFRPAAPPPAAPSAERPARPPPEAVAPQLTIHKFAVEDGTRVAGPEVIRVTAGDAVTLMVTADRADELHVHGYDLHAELRPGEAATLSFAAEHTGRFEIELHGAHLTLATLEVRPR